ncbi:thiol:disulfide interchange protein DsbD [Litchfieldella qijiaojingensis]|uniref:Thiol:disulfide interchange protein DsbD n=1 Tax=Litchfieldella qijiaojingensis TaxID=980347 RepID=A0ABQ2YQW7_9GAMM|nr:thiol:disulfide interchange protein DsbD [Halomonas qijiaojingensis]
MKHRLSILLCCLLMLVPATSQAQWFSSGSNKDEFLPVLEAFQASAWHDDDTLYVGFENAEGYYLYRHRFNVESLDDGTKLGEPILPPGEFKSDEFLGDVYVFYDQVVFEVPFEGNPDGALPFAVTFQGCADAGLCYPPERITLDALPGSAPAVFADWTLDTGASGDATRESPPTPASSAPSLQTQDGRFSALLLDASPMLMLGLFFLAGLGLTFTPCVLPMIPILSSLIVGQNPSRPRAFGLSASYVAGMAATYALVGILMGLFGAGLNLQARLQSAPVLIVFSLLFVIFALAMFGIFNLRLSPVLTTRINAWQARAQRSGPGGLALAGALSVLVVSPCVSAPLAGALVFLSTTGDALMGGLALLTLALGMGVPLLLVGTFGTTLMPRTGTWMNGVKSAFGILLLGVAIWLVERLLPPPLTLLLWAALAIGTAMALGALQVNTTPGWPRLRQGAGVLLLVWGIALIIGAARGAHDPLRPLAPLASSEGPNSPVASTAPQAIVTRLDDLNAELIRAANQGQPVFVDVTADWCISCKQMERTVYSSPQVAELLSAFARIQVDVTDTNGDSQTLLEHFNLFGPPSLLFFAEGEEIRTARIQGEVDRDSFAEHLQQLLQWLSDRPDERQPSVS